MQRILIVEDDEILCEGLKNFLETKGYEVIGAGSIKAARKIWDNKFHLVILDINLPDGDGRRLCQEIRENSLTPVIFLTALDTEDDMVTGFQKGCDDYIAKPFSIELFYQRVKAVLRRSQVPEEKSMFQYHDMTVDFDRMEVFLKNEFVKLSATEYRLLEYLIRNQGQVLTRNQILDAIWDKDGNFVDENTLNVHIRRLRMKLEQDAKNPKYIITVFGIGYTFGESMRKEL